MSADEEDENSTYRHDAYDVSLYASEHPEENEDVKTAQNNPGQDIISSYAKFYDEISKNIEKFNESNKKEEQHDNIKK